MQNEQVEEQFDDPEDFFNGLEWRRYQGWLLDRLTVVYFELGSLAADKSDFTSRFCQMQGQIGVLFNELMMFEVRDKRHAKPEDVQRVDKRKRQGLLDRMKDMILGMLKRGADDA